MTFLPLVQRELRVAARRKSTFRLRSWTAALAIAMSFCSLFFLWLALGIGNAGPRLFTIVTSYTFGVCLLAGPLLTADCLSEEKREGTLGLLFLTDLKGYDVVLGKFVARSLNAFYGLFALLPIIALPLMVGGVTNGEFWRTVLALLSALFFSLSTGVFVSSLAENSRTAIGHTLLLLLVLAGLLPGLAELSASTPASPLVSCLASVSPFYAFSFARETAHASQPATFWISLACSNLLACFFLALSSRLLPNRWQAGGSDRVHLFQRANKPGPTQEMSLRNRLLHINPVLWLAGEVPGLRLLTWSIVLGWGAFLIIAVSKSPRDVVWVYSAAAICAFLLKILVAIQACRFFAEARQNGSLELLLCTPLREGEIIKGQWLALRRVFLWPFSSFLLLSFLVPATGAVIAAYNLSQFLSSVFGLIGRLLAFVWFVIGFAADILAVIWFGMWLALAMKKPQLASAATVCLVLVAPLPLLLMCGNRLADIFFILWGAIKLHQDFRRLAARQYHRAALNEIYPSTPNPPGVPPIIVRTREP